MRRVAEPVRSLPWSRLALTAATAVALVSCSSESSRFANDSLFSSSSSLPKKDVTGSVSRKPAPAVQSTPLPPPVASAPQTRPSAPPVAGVSGGSPGMASFNPPQAALAPAPQRAAQAPAQGGWTWEGGTPITVGQGDSAQTLSQRYGVPVAAILQSNNLSSASAIKPGQRLVIPRYDTRLTTGSVAAPRQAASAPQPATPAAGSGQVVHTIAPGETLMKLSRIYKKPLSEIARANNIPPHTMVKVGDRIVIPGVRAQQTAAPAAPAQPVAQQQKPAPQPPQKWAAAPSTATARAVTPADNPAPETKSVAAASAMPAFRWPVRGRVVSGFGPKTTGQQNNGINVAVPEGTPVKAAEDGVVAYAGNELKSYGNLVLIRHSNGYVTAYAHASEIMVKRDEPIKRGQVIAKSGQTGNVTAPQLHFEIRKGSSPVDPMPYLDKGGG
jgi:murein DD-endopeptidase MepM/ murein hydrolase activator NlpD